MDISNRPPFNYLQYGVTWDFPSGRFLGEKRQKKQISKDCSFLKIHMHHTSHLCIWSRQCLSLFSTTNAEIIDTMKSGFLMRKSRVTSESPLLPILRLTDGPTDQQTGWKSKMPFRMLDNRRQRFAIYIYIVSFDRVGCSIIVNFHELLQIQYYDSMVDKVA